MAVSNIILLKDGSEFQWKSGKDLNLEDLKKIRPTDAELYYKLEPDACFLGYVREKDSQIWVPAAAIVGNTNASEFIKNAPNEQFSRHPPADIEKYPAHCHIRVVDKFQSKGIGKIMTHAWNDYCIKKGVPGQQGWFGEKMIETNKQKLIRMIKRKPQRSLLEIYSKEPWGYDIKEHTIPGIKGKLFSFTKEFKKTVEQNNKISDTSEQSKKETSQIVFGENPQQLLLVKQNIIQSSMPEKETVKCKDCGADITGTKYAVAGYCKRCLEKGRPEEYTKEEMEKVSAGIGTIFKPKEKKTKGPPLWALSRAGDMLKREEAKVASIPQKKEETKSEEKPTVLSQPVSKPPEKRGFKCKDCGQTFYTMDEFNLHKATGDCEEKSKIYKEEEKKKLGFGGAIKGLLREKKEKIKEEVSPTNIALKGLDKIFGKLGESLGIAKSQTKNAILFSIYFPLTIFSITGLLIPSLEGLTGMPINIPGLSWFVSKTWSIIWIVLALMFGVLLPPSLILGKQGVDFGGLNNVLLTTIAISAGVWGTSHIFLPAFQSFMPEEYKITMCLIKYSGNIQICVTNQTQEIKVQKVGTYETLSLEMGVSTPTKTIYPINPNPNLDLNTYPYYFTFTLKNRNEVGSPFEIAVSDIKVTASQSNYNNEKNAIEITTPIQPIKPGGYYIVQAKFTELPECNEQEPYTFFHITLTTEENGGGSSKYGIIETDKGIDNQNFMYFFDPDVKTTPGPLDIYTYTLPFVISFGDIQFQVYTVVENKGNGNASISSLDLVYNTKVMDQPNNCYYVLPNRKIGGIISNEPFDILNTVGELQNGDKLTIVCEGRLKIPEFYGKVTDLVSVVTKYKYKQTFDEQIACIQSSSIAI